MRKPSMILVWTLLLIGAAFGQKDSGLQVVGFDWKPSLPAVDAADSAPVPAATLPRFPDQDYNAPKTPPRPDYDRNVDGTYSINPNSRRNTIQNAGGDPDLTPYPAGAGAVKSIRATLELKNAAPQAIARVEADYVFYDSKKQEYLRYRMTSDKTVKPGDTVKIKNNVTAADLKRFSGRVSETNVFYLAPVETKIEIVSVKYADGTVWTAP